MSGKKREKQDNLTSGHSKIFKAFKIMLIQLPGCCNIVLSFTMKQATEQVDIS